MYDAIKEQYKRDSVEFPETHQSFFKIMTHYVASLGLVPEDVRHMELKRRLFEFIMKNIEYTKVNLIITYPLFFQYFIRNSLYFIMSGWEMGFNLTDLRKVEFALTCLFL